MISATFVPSNDRVVKFMLDRGQRIGDEIEQEMTAISIDLQSYVKANKLSGQILKNRTGNLRRAIDRAVLRSSSGVTATVGVSPNAAKYAGVHEYGGDINIPAVSGKLMVFTVGGHVRFTMKHRAFTVHMPERSFLRSSLAENRAEYLERINLAVAKGATT